ncbi:helix-turn-helix domain-containing protein [Allopusillimonas soli]|uniref:Helix-turn-helix domain-containing protein n=1 Tax=Allopusillimonas soli TaxID=659016 RepID=A0A853FBV4_9BURK|nr:cupin domain-containing protein [Allopusillimonas soli]NYT37248.1 helix-turn-helix domain-containing protein [Allopusillimonas soli]TEA74752.1 helix-turn-helix domain-containing protein [Allopusillimonas soli]
MTDLPYRLKALRRKHQFSLEQLAQRTGLTKSYLSKLERALSEPSISTVLKLAQAYEIGIPELMGTHRDGKDESISVVRRNEREPLDRGSPSQGYRYEAMAGNRLVRVMDPFVVYPPRANEAAPVSFPHAGEEFMLVLKGAISITIGDRKFTLAKGDSIYFDSEIPHKLITTSKVDAQVLVVASRP